MVGANTIGFTRPSNESGYLRFLFTDILGRFRSLQVPRHKSVSALRTGVKTDGSSIPGISAINDSDRKILPDINTRSKVVMPVTNSKEQQLDFVLCNIGNKDNTLLSTCPRSVLQRVLANFDVGLKDSVSLMIGAELEFFLLKKDGEEGFRFDTDAGEYYDNIPFDSLDAMREDIVYTLSTIGISVESTHHEVARSQHEITLTADNALAMADKLVLTKWVIRNIAAAHGYKASFMAKPIEGANGSGLHLHGSVCSSSLNRNYFYEKKSGDLSVMAKRAIAGVLEHSSSVAAFTNPTINSYKRLVPGYEAPVVKAWGDCNRSAMIRIPDFDDESGARFEFRMADASANPYLAIAALATAMQDGITRKLKPPAKTSENLFEANVDLDSFAPGTLEESIVYLQQNEVFRDIMGDEIVDTFCLLKSEEISGYNTYVSPWEIDAYIDV